MIVKKTEKESFDYKTFDSISLALKLDAKDEMLGFYRAFGWELYHEEEDSRYFDIVHVKLARPHRIKNKDKLQLLQVRMESCVNKFAVYKRDKHSASLINILSFSLGGAAFVIGGASLAVSLANPWLSALGIALAVIGAAVPLVQIPRFKRLFRRENRSYAEAYGAVSDEISKILATVRELGGEENG